MVCYVYVIQNQQGRYYIGSTNNLEHRVERHNNNGSFWTKHKGPWKLVFQEKHESRSSATQREKYLKKLKGGKGLKNLLER